MKTAKTKILSLLLPVLWTAPVEAQHIFENQIPVKIQQLRQVADSVQLVADLDLSTLNIGTERYLLLTPVIVSPKGKERRMQSLLINGTQRHKSFMRSAELNRSKRRATDGYHDVIALNKNNRKVYRYRQSIAFESWMRDARMHIVSDLCGCEGFEPRVASEKVANRIILEGARSYHAYPNVAYLRPEAEMVKSRSESTDVFLDFPVSQSAIIPRFGNNPRELAKIEAIVKELRSDANLHVTGVTITGYASPEGNVGMNSQLARDRAEALRNYLSMRSGIPSHLYRVGNGGEDWDGLAHLVQASYIEPKGAILSIILTYMGEERKARLKALAGGAVYQRLLHGYYPKLRRVVSRIDYTVRGFNVEETKEIIRTHPQQLSLNEMFLLANTYPEGSKEFMEVFEIAVRIFPNDPTANLNAAASALLEKDLEKAERYLHKARKNTPAYYNNLGVLNMLQNNNARAGNLFRHAAEGNLKAASKNLDELKKKEEAEKRLTN
jgi:tetratricopeptide (TPR) repeat protein